MAHRQIGEGLRLHHGGTRAQAVQRGDRTGQCLRQELHQVGVARPAACHKQGGGPCWQIVQRPNDAANSQRGKACHGVLIAQVTHIRHRKAVAIQ